MLEFDHVDEHGDPHWTYEPDDRETTYVARIYGLGEPITTAIEVAGEYEARAEQASDAIAEAVEDLLAAPGVVARIWGGAGLVLPSHAAGLPQTQAEPHALAAFTIHDAGADEIEHWLNNRL